MNAMEKMVDVLLCMGILFLMPLLYFDSQRYSTQAILIGQTAETFLNQISVDGEIATQVWTELERVLHELGCVRYEIQREYCLYEPGEEGEVLESVYRLETEEIVEVLEIRGKLPLRKGDTVRLLLYCGELPAVYSTVIRTGGVFR